MTEKNETGELRLLDDQYAGAEVVMLDEGLPQMERIFFRQGIEDLIRRSERLEEGDELVLESVKLDSDFKPIAMCWRLVAKSETAINIRGDDADVGYLYLLEGNHVDGQCADRTFLARNTCAIGDMNMVNYSEILAEYDDALKAWERKQGTLVGADDGLRRQPSGYD